MVSEAVFTKIEMNNEGNVNFLFKKTRYFLESIENKAVFTKTEMNKEGYVHFLQNP